MMMMERERVSEMSPGSNHLLFLSDFNQFPEGTRDSRSPDESSEIDSDVEGAIYAQMYFQDSFEIRKSKPPVPAGVHGSTPTHVATTEADGSHDIFNISLLFSDISESAGKGSKTGKKRKKRRRKSESADDRESSVKKRKKSKPLKSATASKTVATRTEKAVGGRGEDPESPLVVPSLSGTRAVRQGGRNLSNGDPDFEDSRCSVVKKSPALQYSGTSADTYNTSQVGEPARKPLPNEVANWHANSSDNDDTELYVVDEVNIHDGLYATEGGKNFTEDELVTSSEDDRLQIPLLRLAAEQSKLVKPVLPARDSEGLSSDEGDTSDGDSGGSGSSSEGSEEEEGEVCSSDMELCSEGSADDKDLWHIIQKDLMGREAYDQMMGLGGYQLKSKKCMNCKQKGHMARACPHPKRLQTCYLCGGLNHISSNCLQDLCCYCYNRKHRRRQPCHAFGIQCSRCYTDGHHSSMCPDQWRQFHNTTHASSGLVRTGPREQRQNERVFCYNCAQRGHFGFECTRDRPRGWAPSLFPLIVMYDAEWLDGRGHSKQGSSFADVGLSRKAEKKRVALALKRESKKQQRRNSAPLQSSSPPDSYDPRPQSLLGQPKRGLLDTPNLSYHPLQSRSPHSSDLDSPLFDRSSPRHTFPRDHGLLGSPPHLFPRDPHGPRHHPSSSSHHTPRDHSSPYSSTPRHSDLSCEGAEYDFPRTPLPRPRPPPPPPYHQAMSAPQGHRGRRYSNHDFANDSLDSLLPHHPNSDPLPPIRHGQSFHEGSSLSPHHPPALNRRFSDITDTRSSLARYGHGTEPGHKRFQTRNGQLYSERGFRGSEQTARLVKSLNHDITQRRVSYRF